jgi:hypothetical protein
MKLWKDAGATSFTIVGLTLALSVTQGWSWPLLGDARAGIIALAIVGIGACTLSGSEAMTGSIKGPLVIAAIGLGIVAVVAGVIGLFVNTLPYLIVMMVATALLWLVATTRHLLESGSDPRPVVTA